MSETTRNLSRCNQRAWGELKSLRNGAPEVMEAFAAIAQAAPAPKALDRKTKELIALAIAVAVRCDDCIAFHAEAAVEQGDSSEEAAENLATAIYMGAGPSVMYAGHALLRAFTQFAGHATTTVDASRQAVVQFMLFSRNDDVVAASPASTYGGGSRP
jgi:AhpD family alkylhydroperoxidase